MKALTRYIAREPVRFGSALVAVVIMVIAVATATPVEVVLGTLLAIVAVFEHVRDAVAPTVEKVLVPFQEEE